MGIGYHGWMPDGNPMLPWFSDNGSWNLKGGGGEGSRKKGDSSWDMRIILFHNNSFS